MNSFVYRPDAAVVQTTHGKVRGYIWNDIAVFKGIPYARARRFHAPEPTEDWTDVFDATSFGYTCPLLKQDRPSGEVYVPHRFWPADEDCMNLNVWTPGLDHGKRPVLVWLHGGGFTSGSSIEHLAYEGENMARFGDAVVVTVNHRLNVLGYFDLSEYGKEYENSGNAGGDDIIESLRWVRDNIAAFGGDPGNVTVFGHSGGGEKVSMLLQSPAADGLFHKGFVMSGVFRGVQIDENSSSRELAEAVMSKLNAATVKEMESVPYSALAAAYNAVAPEFAKQGKYYGGYPRTNAFCAGNPVWVPFRKESADIPLLVGSTFAEFTTFLPSEVDRRLGKADTDAFLANLYGREAAESLSALFEKAYPERPPMDVVHVDTHCRVPETQYIRKRSALNSRTWSYIFNEDIPVDGGRVPWHCADIPFVFHNTAFTPYATIPGVTEKLESEIFDSVMAFARTGDPNNASVPAWPACTPESEAVMIFDEQTRVRVNFDHELIPAMEAARKKLAEKAPAIAGPF